MGVKGGASSTVDGRQCARAVEGEWREWQGTEQRESTKRGGKTLKFCPRPTSEHLCQEIRNILALAGALPTCSQSRSLQGAAVRADHLCLLPLERPPTAGMTVSSDHSCPVRTSTAQPAPPPGSTALRCFWGALTSIPCTPVQGPRD